MLQDGLESISQLRVWEKSGFGGSKDRKRQYIIGASACSGEETRRAAIETSGSDEFLQKPVDLGTLAEKIVHLFKSEQQAKDKKKV